MKQMAKLFGVIAVAASVGLSAAPQILAAVGYRGEYYGGNRGWYHGGYWGGYRGGYWGGWWYPWAFSLSYYGAPYYYYYPAPVYYYPPSAYYPAPAVYSSQPAVAYGSPPPSTTDSAAMSVPDDTRTPEADRPLAPSAVYKDPSGLPPSTPNRVQPRWMPPVQPISVTDVKAMVKAGVADGVVINQIQQSRVVFRLSTQEIIDLKESGVSNKVIDFMINTAGRQGQ